MQNNYVFVGDFHSIVKFSFKLIFIFFILTKLSPLISIKEVQLRTKSDGIHLDNFLSDSHIFCQKQFADSYSHNCFYAY